MRHSPHHEKRERWGMERGGAVEILDSRGTRFEFGFSKRDLRGTRRFLFIEKR